MKKTIFSGLTVLRPDESIQSDNGAFTGRDRLEIDRGIKIGVKTHRHTEEAGLTDPLVAPSGEVIASGGTVPGGLSISLAYTLQDLAGGETLPSPIMTVSTPGPLAAPLVAPVGAFSSASGALMVDTYTYALTYSDGEGGETPVGPSTTVTRPPGFASGQIVLTGLNVGLEEAGAAGWRLYRARGGGEYVFLTSGGPSDSEFTDDGSVSADCDTHPPTDNINTTKQANQLKVTLPSGATIDGAAFINLYGSLTGEFGESSLLAQYPVASAGAVDFLTSFEPIEGQPPDVNRSYGGAPKIDPDTEILDWHWKRPVATIQDLPDEGNEEADVRVVEQTGIAYIFHEGAWKEFSGGGNVDLLGSGSFTDHFTGSALSSEWTNEFGFISSHLLVASGVLAPKKQIEGIGIFLDHPPAFSDGRVVYKFHTGASPKGTTGLTAGLILRRNGEEYLSFTVSSESFSEITAETSEGPSAIVEEVAPAFKADTDYWFVGEAIGNSVRMEVLEGGPPGEGTAVFAVEGAIEGATAIAEVGAGVGGGMQVWLPPVAADWRWDDFSLEVNPLRADSIELIGSGGIAISQAEDDAGHVEVTVSGPGALLADHGMGVIVIPVSEKGIARPTDFKQYTWYCKEEPTNLGQFDIWIEEGP